MVEGLGVFREGCCEAQGLGGEGRLVAAVDMTSALLVVLGTVAAESALSEVVLDYRCGRWSNAMFRRP